MALTRERLNLAGTLAIVLAILVIPNIIFNMWMNSVQGPVGAALWLGRGLILLPMAFTVLLTLRLLLHERAGWHALDRLIAVSIGLSVISLVLSTLIRLTGLEGLAFGNELILGAAGAVVGLMMGLRLRELGDELFGLRRALAWCWVASSAGSLLYLALGALAALGLGALGAIIGLIFILDVLFLVVVEIAVAVIEGRILHQAAAQSPEPPLGGVAAGNA